mgnify:CR=1 FL=1
MTRVPCRGLSLRAGGLYRYDHVSLSPTASQALEQGAARSSVDPRPSSVEALDRIIGGVCARKFVYVAITCASTDTPLSLSIVRPSSHNVLAFFGDIVTEATALHLL